MNKQLSAIKTDLETKITERATQREEYASKLAAAKTSLSEALERKAAMISGENVKAVRLARENAADAQAAIEIYEAKLDTLTARPVIDDAEAEALLNKLSNTYTENENRIIKKAKGLLENLLALEKEYCELGNDAESMAKQICFSLNDSDRFYVIAPNGKRMAPKPLGVVGDRYFSHLVDYIKLHYGYKRMFGLPDADPIEKDWTNK